MNTNTNTKAMAVIIRDGREIVTGCDLWHAMRDANLTSDVQRAQAIFNIATPGSLVVNVVRVEV